ncbi:hypothetical protein K501DRAFT_288521, partial [Backusella circina FSU 941]
KYASLGYEHSTIQKNQEHIRRLEEQREELISDILEKQKLEESISHSIATKQKYIQEQEIISLEETFVNNKTTRTSVMEQQQQQDQ